MISIVETVNCFQQIGTSALLIISDYILGQIWGNGSIYLFNSHNKDNNDNIASTGTAVLIKFDTLYLFENYVRWIYYYFPSDFALWNDGNEITENISDRGVTEFGSVEDPLNMHRTNCFKWYNSNFWDSKCH